MKVLNILIRRCVLIARFEDTVSFYENLIAQKARLRFDYPNTISNWRRWVPCF